jgi:hypothetical protein
VISADVALTERRTRPALTPSGLSPVCRCGRWSTPIATAIIRTATTWSAGRYCGATSGAARRYRPRRCLLRRGSGRTWTGATLSQRRRSYTEGVTLWSGSLRCEVR